MRECACGYTCGTEVALLRHVERNVHGHCRALAPREPTQEELFAAREDQVRARLLEAAREGDAIAVRGVLAKGLVMHSAAPLEAAVRGGHAGAASVLIRHHCRAKYRRPLDGPNVVANALNWAASGYCGLAGPNIVAMLTTDRHLDALRKGPLSSWQRMSQLLGQPGRSEADDDGPFTLAGQNALASARRAAGPVPVEFDSSGRRRPGAAKMAAQALVAEQLQLVASDLDRRGWSPDAHAEHPPRFRAVVRTLLLCAHSPGSLLAKLPVEVVLHLVAVLARRTFWELAPPASVRVPLTAGWTQMRDPQSGARYMDHPNMPYNMHSAEDGDG